MKFAIAVVVLAVVLGAHAGVLPLAPLSYTAVSGPTLLHASPLVYHAVPPAAVAVHESPAIIEARAVPTVYHAPAVVAAPAPVLVAAEGTYVARTRGAEHVAPLPGHANSAASINLEPAPGTF